MPLKETRCGLPSSCASPLLSIHGRSLSCASGGWVVSFLREACPFPRVRGREGEEYGSIVASGERRERERRRGGRERGREREGGRGRGRASAWSERGERLHVVQPFRGGWRGQLPSGRRARQELERAQEEKDARWTAQLRVHGRWGRMRREATKEQGCEGRGAVGGRREGGEGRRGGGRERGGRAHTRSNVESVRSWLTGTGSSAPRPQDQ